mmetsp:Transcript_15412/g.32211  ORF Transcript_15412/g.32211 Transcript_15412/m.32211 type:complete len:200 (+) Transcript_15412:576-1175(+)
MRPGRMSAGSSFSGWLVVMTRIRFGVSTTPSSTLSRPERSSLSDLDVGFHGPFTLLSLSLPVSIMEAITAAIIAPSPLSPPLASSSSSSSTLSSFFVGALGLVLSSFASSTPPSLPSTDLAEVRSVLPRLPSLGAAGGPPSASSPGLYPSACCFVIWSVMSLANPLPPSRRCTILDAASTSSMTKITSLKPSLIGTSIP